MPLIPCANPRCKRGVDGEPMNFRPKRRWQVFCSTRCRQATHNRRLYRKATAASRRQGDACNTHLSARRPWHFKMALVEGDGVFSMIAGRPRNFAAELAALAARNPRFVLRLTAEALRRRGTEAAA